LIFYFEVIKYI